MVAGRAAALAISYIAHPYRPRFCLEARDALLGFSKWLFFNNLLFSVQMRAQDFVIGKVSGPSGLGLYNVSYEIATLPSTSIVFPINRAVFPGFAKLAQEPGALVRGYLQVTGLIALLIIPAGLGIAATAQLLIPAVLGDKWLSAIPIVQILSFYGVLAALSSVFGPTFMAMGRPRMLSVFTVVNVVLFVPAVIYGALTADVIGAAWGCLAVVSVMMPASHWMAARALGTRVSEITRQLWRPFVAGGVMYLAVSSFVAWSGVPAGSLDAIPPLIGAVSMGVAIYPLCLAGLWLLAGRPEGAERLVISEVKARMARRRSG
jgi:O-antigen/teichoic acid export membrane protein